MNDCYLKMCTNKLLYDIYSVQSVHNKIMKMQEEAAVQRILLHSKVHAGFQSLQGINYVVTSHCCYGLSQIYAAQAILSTPNHRSTELLIFVQGAAVPQPSFTFTYKVKQYIPRKSDGIKQARLLLTFCLFCFSCFHCHLNYYCSFCCCLIGYTCDLQVYHQND